MVNEVVAKAVLVIFVRLQEQFRKRCQMLFRLEKDGLNGLNGESNPSKDLWLKNTRFRNHARRGVVEVLLAFWLDVDKPSWGEVRRSEKHRQSSTPIPANSFATRTQVERQWRTARKVYSSFQVEP